MKNMKIEINEQQPLEDVVKELERLGIKMLFNPKIGLNFKCVSVYGGFADFHLWKNPNHKLTTLAELKEM